MKPLRLFLITALLALMAPSMAAAEPPIPPRNLELGSMPSVCSQATPPMPLCGNAVIYYLDQARATMGLGPYNLPANFLSMAPDQQMFILSNLDRISYALPPVAGLNAGLSADAAKGAEENRDPEVDFSKSSSFAFIYGSNWAGSFSSVMMTYFFWYYSDGFESGNADCPTATSPGCWGHRRNILLALPTPSKGPEVLYSMGAAKTTDQGNSYAQLIVVTDPSNPPPYYYSWAQAVLEGAGTNIYSVSAPKTSASLRVNIKGQGHVFGVQGAMFNCTRSCVAEIQLYQPFSLRAIPKHGSRLVSWRGCATTKVVRKRGDCSMEEAQGDQEINVVFTRARHKTHHKKRKHGSGTPMNSPAEIDSNSFP